MIGANLYHVVAAGIETFRHNDGLVQERRNSSVLVFLALIHRYAITILQASKLIGRQAIS